MNTYLIVAHPEPASFNANLVSTAMSTFDVGFFENHTSDLHRPVNFRSSHILIYCYFREILGLFPLANPAFKNLPVSPIISQNLLHTLQHGFALSAPAIKTRSDLWSSLAR